MSYLNTKDKFVAALMALSTIGLLGAFYALLGAKRTLAEPLPTAPQLSVTAAPGVESLGALVLGGLCLSFTRRMLRG